MESKCGACGADITSDETQCPNCGHINKHPNPSEWIQTRRKFLEALKGYVPQCPNCGAFILTEDECDMFDEEGISGEGDLQLKPLAIRSVKRPDRCLYCEDTERV
jgi:predicted RNA-binding Zn-ribbon protein involved in translation (DUF1610 family)